MVLSTGDINKKKEDSPCPLEAYSSVRKKAGKRGREGYQGGTALEASC